MDEAHSSFLLQVDALSGHCDQLARGAHLNDAALASLAATLRAAREITLALDGACRACRPMEAGGSRMEERALERGLIPCPPPVRACVHACNTTGEAQVQQDQERGGGYGAEGTGDAVFRMAILAQATKLIGRCVHTCDCRGRRHGFCNLSAHAFTPYL